jgi:hypothetical protein
MSCLNVALCCQLGPETLLETAAIQNPIDWVATIDEVYPFVCLENSTGGGYIYLYCFGNQYHENCAHINKDANRT